MMKEKKEEKRIKKRKLVLSPSAPSLPQEKRERREKQEKQEEQEKQEKQEEQEEERGSEEAEEEVEVKQKGKKKRKTAEEGDVGLSRAITSPSSIEVQLGEEVLNYDFARLKWERKGDIVPPSSSSLTKAEREAERGTEGQSRERDVNTAQAVASMGFTRMTEIQARAIPALMAGVDVLAQAKTGSGKTLAFLIPVVHLLWSLGFKQRNGVGALIIAPTRELALQIYGVARELTAHHQMAVGCVMGGANRKAEVDKLSKGCPLLVATPGRLLDHLMNTPQLVVANLKCLIIDEADRILEIGFEKELLDILSRLPSKDRQTALFSATQSQNVKDLVKLSFKRNPLYINVSDNTIAATVSTLEQGYVICPSAQRFLLLFTFLKKNLIKKKKIIVFFSTCAATQFYAELLNYIDLPVMELHGQMKQNKRTSTFFEFVNAPHGIMLATDVAARGLDIPKVDWIIQFDPPDDPKEYIHRVGRTARGTNSAGGKALLFLLSTELLFLKYLKTARIPLNEYEFPINKLATVQNQLEALISKNYYLHKSAREAYRSYLQSYSQHSLKQCFDVHSLNVADVAASFGFQSPPQVQLKIGIKSKASKKHGFSEDNPYGTTKTGGAKESQPQWSR